MKGVYLNLKRDYLWVVFSSLFLYQIKVIFVENRSANARNVH